MKQYMVWQRGLSLSLSGEKDEQVRTGGGGWRPCHSISCDRLTHRPTFFLNSSLLSLHSFCNYTFRYMSRSVTARQLAQTRVKHNWTIRICKLFKKAHQHGGFNAQQALLLFRVFKCPMHSKLGYGQRNTQIYANTKVTQKLPQIQIYAMSEQ